MPWPKEQHEFDGYLYLVAAAAPGGVRDWVIPRVEVAMGCSHHHLFSSHWLRQAAVAVVVCEWVVHLTNATTSCCCCHQDKKPVSLVGCRWQLAAAAPPLPWFYDHLLGHKIERGPCNKCQCVWIMQKPQPSKKRAIALVVDSHYYTSSQVQSH